MTSEGGHRQAGASGLRTAPSSPFPVFLGAAAIWAAALFGFAAFAARRPPSWGAWVALALTAAFLALALGAVATVLSHGVSQLVSGDRWSRGFDLAQAVLVGAGATWAFLSLVKFEATRAHLSWNDLRFLLGSLRQVSAEAGAAERRLLWLALLVPLAVTAIAYVALRARRGRAGGASPRAKGASPKQLVALAAVAGAGLLTLALRQPYARFVLAEVAPGTSWIARRFSGAATLGGAPDRAFVPDPLRHRRIEPYVAPDSFRRANVVVLMLESIPWSRLFGPQARPESTPRLLALARESTLFARAYATATHSDYAQTSILASLHPRRLDRHDFFVELDYPRTLPWDLLAPLGYRSAIFSCQNEGWGNMAAFLKTPRLELFRHSPDWPDAPRRGAGAGAEAKVFEPTPLAAFLSWVAAAPAKPFVAYLNFQATHYPYVVPPDEPEPYGPAAIDFPTTFLSYPLDRIPVMENRFHNALAYVDGQVGRLVDGLAAAGVWENTALLVVSDHGEAFYEHGIPTHGTTLHEEQVRTAMLLRLPGETGRTLDAPVSVLDVLPSLYAWMGLPDHGNFQGRSDVLTSGYRRDGGRERPLSFTIQGMTREDGLLEGDWKWIVNWDRDERALFDLAADPGERANLADSERTRGAALDRELSRLVLEQLAYYRERGWELGYYPPRLP